MMEIFKSERYLNIFTDGSIYTDPNTNETIGCPGSVMYHNGTVKNRSLILRNSTNNESEITAIYMGVMDAIEFINSTNTIPIINIFSDSKISVLGLRDWIFKWYKCCMHGIMYSSSGQPVANQEVYKHIVLTIVENNININLYHQKGHVNVDKDDSVLNALKVFNVSNNTKINDMEFIKTISYYNNMVDLSTKEYLQNFILSEYEQMEKYDKCMVYNIENSELLNKYRSLIKRSIKR